jgi:glutamate synthase domain-containing protein 1
MCPDTRTPPPPPMTRLHLAVWLTELRCGVEQTAAAEGFKVVGWRDVPVNLTVVGKYSKATQPIIAQAIVQSEKGLEENDLERGLYLVRPLRCSLSLVAVSVTALAYAHGLTHCTLTGHVLLALAALCLRLRKTN